MASSAFATLTESLHALLDSPLRQQVVDEARAAGTLGPALLRLRDHMRSHLWQVGGRSFDLARALQKLDRKTRQVGFHVLHDWDGIADRVNDDMIPVDVLHYLAERRGNAPADHGTLAILVDYYFMHVLGLLSVRVFDDGDPNRNMDLVEGLRQALQGPYGSGQPFTADAETLLLLATSHYEMYERGYAVLLDQVRALDASHRLRVALGHASSMGCHLRFGFEATYGRDTVNMREDNVADYPWLLFALNTALQHYATARTQGVDAAVLTPCIEALVHGLSGDARAFVGRPPTSLQHVASERVEFYETFQAYRDELLPLFERYRPTTERYSPLCFFFNFSHNVVKGTVVDALVEGRPWALTFNDLLTSREEGTSSAEKRALTGTLMDYARANPQTIRGRPMPVIVYDATAGRQAFAVTMRKLQEPLNV